MEKKNKAVVTVVGNDTIGIIARVSAALAQHEANILDISQTVLSGMFNMMMIPGRASLRHQVRLTR